MLILGLTGGVASGKNFVASCFKRLKIPVFDADLEVHMLLLGNKNIFKQIQQNFPDSIINNKIDRKILGEQVFANQQKLHNLEQIIYPILRVREDSFIKNCRRNHQQMAILNIPLLFEKGGYKRCHKSIAIITPPKTQLSRFKNRLKSKIVGDSKLICKKFYDITKYQIDNLQRKKIANYIIYNGLNKAFTFRQVQNLFYTNYYDNWYYTLNLK